MKPVERELTRLIEEQRRAEEDQASREVLRSIQKALKEALLALPAEEYDWFNVREGRNKSVKKTPAPASDSAQAMILHDGEGAAETEAAESPQKEFFEYAGPLHSVKISPASSVVPVKTARTFRAIPRDRAHHLIEERLEFQWRILEGGGTLENAAGEIVPFQAGSEPGLVRLGVTVRQDAIECRAEALITVTESLLPPGRAGETNQRGIPGYTFQKAPGELWRSRFDPEQNVVTINNGHRDFVFASRTKALKLRYICRLFAKELILKNFMGAPSDALLERMIELSMYTEENLK